MPAPQGAMLSRGTGASLRGRRSLDLGRGPRGSVGVTQATAMAAQTRGYRMQEKHVGLPARHSPALVGLHGIHRL